MKSDPTGYAEAKLTELTEQLASETGVDKDAVAKVLSHLGLKEQITRQVRIDPSHLRVAIVQPAQ